MASLIRFFLSLLLFISLSLPSSDSLSFSTSPLTSESYLFRYWNRKITTNSNINDHNRHLPQPPLFFTSKLSPLSPQELSTFSSLTPSNLSSHLPSFCSAARLLCPSLTSSPLSRIAADKNSGLSSNYTTGIVATGSDVQVSPLMVKQQQNAIKDPPSRRVEPGMFFRERELTMGTVMPMPDIRDKTQARSFLPREIAGKIPFSATEVMSVFDIPPGSAMERAVERTIRDCMRAPGRGETKRCATSAEDMVDFAVSALGPNVVVRSTENTMGSKGDILIGDVKGVNGGKVTKSVSCHQSMFPYLVYFCHSVPKVRVYEAEILDVSTQERINRGVAICHLDTSDWSAGHDAFVALGSAPGQTEACHWIFQGDMSWAVAD